MRLSVLLLGLVFVMLSAAVAVVAQPPMPPGSQPPAILPAAPAAPQPPAVNVPQAIPGTQVPAQGPVAAVEVPLNRFEPLAAWPPITQEVVRSTLLAGNWMTGRNQSHGRFQFGFDPALRQPNLKDHDLLQARGALATAQLAAFTGDEKQAAVATQAILTLLAATRPDPADPACRLPIQSSFACNRIGFAAALALAIYSLPGADATRLAEAEQLCEFIHKHCRPDGSIQYTDAENSMQVDPNGVNEYPGLALHAIMSGNRLRPAPWKTEVLAKALAYYRGIFRAQPHPLLAATLTPAFVELYLQAKSGEAASFVFELNDALCEYQIHARNTQLAQYIGGFRTVVNQKPTDVLSGPETGFYLQSLCLARRLAKPLPDASRHMKYQVASEEAVHYLMGLQYIEANTRHFETSFRVSMLIGAFHLSPIDGSLRIDATANAASGLLAFLYTVLDRS